MATEPVLAFEVMLAPISEDEPTGVDIQKSGLLDFSEIRSAANSARRAEAEWRKMPLDDKGSPTVPDGETPPEDPVWNAVAEKAIRVLSQQTKDLRLASYLIEALARLHGFAGLRDGFRLVRELAEKYWGQLYPELEVLDPEEPHTAVASISSLDGDSVLPQAIKGITIVPRSSRTDFTSVDYIDATEGKSRRIDIEELRSAANLVEPSYFETMLEDCEQALQQFKQMIAALDEKCGKSDEGYDLGPSGSNIRNTLEDCCHRIRDLAPTAIATPGGESSMAEETDQKAAGILTPEPRGGIRTSADAYNALLRVAEYFEANERHSPASGLLREIIKWRNLSFGDVISRDLMKLLIENKDTFGNVFPATGDHNENETE